MAADPTLVGLDVGTTGVKAIAIAPDGAVVARAEREYRLDAAAGLGRAGSGGLVAGRRGGAPRLGPLEVRIGLTGQMHGFVALDAGDRVLRPAILWNDQRTAAECAQIEERVGLEGLIALTGNRALTGFTAPKRFRIRRHEPEVYARIAHVLLPKDYVRLRLTGERASDVADASGTLLFDVAHRRWSREMLDALEFPRLAAAGARVAGGQRTGDGRLSPPAQATRPRRRSESVSTAPEPHRSCSAPRASCSRRSRRMPRSPRRASTPPATPGTWHAMGARSRLPARCAGFATPAPRESRTTPCSRRRRRAAGRRRADVPAVPRR